MTCKEFQFHFGISTRAPVLTGSDELSEHRRTCADCRRFFQMHQEVGRHLCVVGDSVPQISAALDARVLASYRDFVAGRTTGSVTVSLRKRIAPLVLSWRGAVAAGVLAAAILALTLRREGRIAPSSARESATIPQAPNLEIAATTIPKKTTPQMRNAHHPKRKGSAVSVASASNSVPVGFTSLMFCDQLSCAEAMEIVRVQLPTSIAGLTSGPTDEMVFADVLVGPDGIARGIRIVE